MHSDATTCGKRKSTWIVTWLIFILLIGSGMASAKTDYLNRDDLFSIFFVNDVLGWSCGRWGTILHTTDGGKTWQEQKSGIQNTLSSIFFADPLNGWAVGNSGTILHTQNGGETWENQESPVPYYHMGVFFTTLEKGWIASEKTHLLHTQDGGKTWRVSFSDEDYILKSVSFSDSMHGWAVGEFGHVYRTADGGISWKKLAGEAYIDMNTGDLKGGPFLYNVTAIDGRTAWATGIEGRVVMTADEGKTWHEVETGAPHTPLYGIGSDDRKTVVIVGKGVSLLSENNGLTWQHANFSPRIDYTWIYDVAAIGKNHFAACGEEGQIYIGNSTLFKKVR